MAATPESRCRTFGCTAVVEPVLYAQLPRQRRHPTIQPRPKRFPYLLEADGSVRSDAKIRCSQPGYTATSTWGGSTWCTTTATPQHGDTAGRCSSSEPSAAERRGVSTSKGKRANDPERTTFQQEPKTNYPTGQLVNRCASSDTRVPRLVGNSHRDR